MGERKVSGQSGAMIRLSQVGVKLGGRWILRGVDLAVKAGESVAVMGLSGSGKSILARTAVGLFRPDEGEVWLRGENLAALSARRLRQLRQKVGMLFQGNALFDSMTVKENIGFVLREVLDIPPSQVEERVEELLVRLRLGPIGDKYPAQLSGGMKKRVSIARAVAHDPEILFYDDPTAGLDPITSMVIADLIAELGSRPGRSVLLISNQLPVVMKTTSRAVLLSAGKVVELGPTEDLLASTQTELREFLEGDAHRA